MSHRPISEDDLHAYVDRALEPEREAEVAAYLQDHPDVAKRIADYSDQRCWLRLKTCPTPTPPGCSIFRSAP